MWIGIGAGVGVGVGAGRGLDARAGSADISNKKIVRKELHLCMCVSLIVGPYAPPFSLSLMSNAEAL